MERVLAWIRDNPQFAALSFSAAIVAFVMTVLAIMMTRAGVSLKPIFWFLGFLGIVAGPQAVVHLLDGFVLRRAAQETPKRVEAPAEATVSRAVKGSAFAPVAWETVFGPKADPALMTDAKLGLAPIVGEASEAKLSFDASGESALAARFSSAAEAAKALNTYGTFFAFAQVRGSDASGWTARRHGGQGEWVHVVTAGPELYAWTAATREAVLAHRVRALGPVRDDEPPAARASDPATAQPELVSKRLSQNVRLMLAIVGLNLVAAGLWFFKGSAWAARIEGSEAGRPAAEQTLRDALLALNKTDIPTEVKSHPDGTLEINWRYADARWFDLMRLHRMKRTQRLVLSFDERNHTVRMREYWSAFDASAGAGSLRLDWKAATGIQFFAVEHKRVFGAQLGPDGKPTGALSKAYTFNLQALKAPFIEAVTRAGWRWQPLAWNAPESLRWLTE